MKIEDALRLNEGAFLVDQNGNTDAFLIEANSLACVALQRMISIKPVLKLHTNRVPEDQKEYYCPTCDEQLTWNGTKPKHCEECGQAIDWSYQ